MDNSILLRRTVATNGIVTLLFGAALLIGRAPITELMGIASAAPVAIAGGICVAFAPVLLLAARKPDLGARLAALLIAIDGAWVVASLVVAAAAPISGIGRVLIAAQAALVVVFIVLETAGLRRLQPLAA
jgi:hypothetical protein